MSTPFEDDDDRNNIRYAEYVLGVLDADARASVAHEVASSEQAALAVALWQRRLLPLAEDAPEIAPSDVVWPRIRAALSWDAQRRPAQRPTTSSSARPWQWISAGAVLVAAACIVMLVRAPVQPPQPARGPLMVATIRQDDGVTDWTATMDLDRKQIVVVPAANAAIPTGRTTELWLIPAGQAPIAVGVFASNATAVLPLNAELLAKLGPTAALAVSVEPPGGSPTGQPTGPVIAKGAISGTQS